MMTSDELDRILASPDVVRPSASFARNVMAAVQREASEPPPVRFPWIRFSVGICAAGAMAGSAGVLVSDVSVPLASTIAPELACAFAAVLIGYATAVLPRVLSRS
jgi:hypothetical protein